MLPPDRRTLYSDALRPPPGYTLDRAIGATYSLDLATLLVFPLHLALLDAGGRGEDALRDGVAVMEAVRRLTSKLAIFTQQGQVHAPKLPHVLYSLLEPIVCEVRAPRQYGVFHTKFWLLRYTREDDGQALLRLVIPTRNITTDRCWDMVLTLEGEPQRKPIGDNRGLREMIEALPSLARTPVTDDLRTSLSALADEAYRTPWDLPEKFESVRFHAIGLRGKEWGLPECDRLAVISPFLSEGALGTLAKSTRNAIALISRPEELAKIPKEALAKFGRISILHERTQPDDVEEPESASALQHPTAGLHAKVYIAENGWNTHLLVGSANATNAAFARNVEIMAELIGKRSKVGGIDDLLSADGLGGLLSEYTPPDEPELETAEQRAAHQALLDAQRELSDAGMRVVCRREGVEWICKLRASNPVLLTGITEANTWLATRAATTAVDLLPLRSSAVAWSPSSTEQVTGLVAFELAASGSDERLRFVLNLPLEGVDADQREGAILRSVLNNREGLLRYLLLLLADDPTLFAEVPFGQSESKSMDWLRTAETAPLLEEMTRALHRDPERLRAIGYTLERLSKDETTIVPPEFVQLWQAFEAVLKETA